MDTYCDLVSSIYEINNKFKIGIECQICNINESIHFKSLHGFNNHGIVICNNTCIVSAEKQIDDIFNKYPIYDLNLNRNDIIYNNKILSTIKTGTYYLYFIGECIGLTFLISGKFYITLYHEKYTSGSTNCPVFDLKEIYETNDFSDEEIVSFPDPVKEYLGIPLNSMELNSIELKFVD
jgi:hypothetical protein